MVKDGREGLQEGYAAHVEEEFYTVQEAARILRTTEQTVRALRRRIAPSR